MATGAGKYNDEATRVRLNTQAQGVVLIVVGGTHGEGFEVQATGPLLLTLPGMLRHMADHIEADLKRLADDPAQLKKAHE